MLLLNQEKSGKFMFGSLDRIPIFRCADQQGDDEITEFNLIFSGNVNAYSFSVRKEKGKMSKRFKE